MGTITGIQWTDHTFNCWRGCDKVSAGCDNCYAETMSHRNPTVLGVWGPDGTRAMAAEAYWRLPQKWDRLAAAEGRRHRVFCLSLGDWLEDRAELIAPRARLLEIVDQTPHLDWLLLTKRPEGWEDRLYEVVRQTHDEGSLIASYWLDGYPPANVWLGVSAEDQPTFDQRWGHARQIMAAVHFFSMEPLLGPIVLPHIDSDYTPWIIVGGESGPGARPMHPEWARTLRDQCVAAGVAFFFKQWGEWLPGTWGGVRTIPDTYVFEDGLDVTRVGKQAADRVLDGRTWDEFPVSEEV